MPTIPRWLKVAAAAVLPDRIMLAAKRKYYVRDLKRMRGNEEPEFEIVRALVEPGDLVADVGANVGVYTKVLADIVGEQGHVFSFEPIPVTYDILQAVVKALGYQNVTTHAVALSDAQRTVTMEIPQYRKGGENYHMAQIVTGEVRKGLRKFTIETATMDSFFGAIQQRVSFVKCDVEGHELNTVRGALGVIKRDQPSWLIEVSEDPDDPKSSAAELFKLFDTEGYEPYCLDGQTLRLRRRGDRSVNYFFLSKQQAAVLGDRKGS